jgi:nucleoside-diphosphate-sugar epimerase
MRIFITGASGYLGSAVSAALARSDHEVLGLVRSESKASRAARAEVRPVIGSMQEPARWIDEVRTCEVLIHCAAEYSPQVWDLDCSTAEALIGAAYETRRPRLFVYTSGVWIYGNTGGRMVTEAAAPNPPAFAAPRLQNEELVLRENRGTLRTLIVRPGCVYGGSGGLTGAWFDSAASAGAARVVGDGRFRWSMVHIEDLADLYRRAVESPWRGEIFNATDRSRFSVLECAMAASYAAGAGGKVQLVPFEEASQQMGSYAECLTLDQHVDSSHAVRLLGWQPRHGGFVDGAERYYASWRAAHGV